MERRRRRNQVLASDATADDDRPRLVRPGHAGRLAAGSPMKSRAVLRPFDHRCWEIATTSAFALFGICLGSGLQASPVAWTGTVMIIAYGLGAVTMALAACRLTDVRFPLPGPPEPSFPIRQGPPGDPWSNRREALDTNRPGGQDAACGVPAERTAPSADQRWLSG